MFFTSNVVGLLHHSMQLPFIASNN